MTQAGKRRDPVVSRRYKIMCPTPISKLIHVMMLWIVAAGLDREGSHTGQSLLLGIIGRLALNILFTA